MDRNKIWEKIELAVRADRATSFPYHAAAKAGRVTAAAGNLMASCLAFKYNDGQVKEMEQQAINVAAQAIRFLENINNGENKIEKIINDAKDD